MRLFKFLLLFAIILRFPGTIYGQITPEYNVTYYDSASTGYYFFSSFKIGVIPGSIYQYHMIVDSTGRLVYYKSFPNGTNTLDFKLQPNGLMSYTYQAKHFIMDSTFTIIDSVSCPNGLTTDVHDFQMLPNGHYLLLGMEEVQMDLSSYFYFGPSNSAPGSSNAHVKSCVIQELDTAKNLVFDWHSTNHFAFTDVDTAFMQNPNTVDWTHSNSIELDYDGNIILSSRHFNEVTKINRTTGAVMWRLGGNANQFTFLNDPMQFKRQHDARRLPNGNLTLFDNGNGYYSSPFHYASGKEYHIDEIALTAELVWSYIDDSSEYSTAMGSFQRVPGGISVVDYGITFSQNKVFSAMDDLGQKVFEIQFPLALQSYRAHNYQQMPWSFIRPEITCFENNGQLYLDAGPGHPKYQWSNGDSTQVIAVSVSDTFFVFVPYGDGGMISSEWTVVDNPLTYCNLNSDEISDNEIKSFVVNPVVDEFEIYFSSVDFTNKQIVISDISGKIIQSLMASNQSRVKIPCDNLAEGVYFVRVDNRVFKILKF